MDYFNQYGFDDNFKNANDTNFYGYSKNRFDNNCRYSQHNDNRYDMNDFNCCPSYYNEEKDCRRERKCWEGTFRICEPSYRDEKKDDCHKRENNCRPRCFSLCNLFRNCCRW